MRLRAFGFAVLVAALGLGAAPLAGAQSVSQPVFVDPTVTRLQDRVESLEAEVRAQTNAAERAQFELSRLKADYEKLDRLNAELQRERDELQRERDQMRLERDQMAAMIPGGGEASPPPQRPLPPASPPQASAPAPTVAMDLPSAPGDAFRKARSQLARGDYASAEATLAAFVRTFKADPLTPDAKYWLGQTQLARDSHSEAAQTFLGLLRDHPEAARVPDATVWLGVALRRMGQKDQACRVFAQGAQRVAKTAGALRGVLDRESAAAGCPT